MPTGSLPGRFVAFASLLAVPSLIASQAGFDAAQSSIHVYQHDDNDFERYIYLRDPETGRLPYQTEFAQRFRLPRGGTVRYVEVCVQKPRDALPEDDLLVYIVRIYSDAGNVPGETVVNDVGQFSWMTHVPAGYRVCHKVPVGVGPASPSGFKVNAGPVWVGLAWGDDPAVEQNLQELAVDGDNSGGRRAFRVIHDEGGDWEAWQADTDSGAYAIRVAVEHSDPEPEPDPDPPPPLRAGFEVAGAACDAELCRAVTGEAVRLVDTSTGTVRSRTWEFGDGTTSRLPTVEQSWSSSGFFEVTLSVSNGTAVSTASRKFLVEAAEPRGTCAADAETRCLHDSRYAVTVEWRKSDGETGAGRVVHEGTNDSGLFSFFSRENWEVLIKVLDGCAVNGHVWVYGASTTDLGYVLRVTDTVTGRVREYRNNPGLPAPGITDTTAFEDSCKAM